MNVKVREMSQSKVIVNAGSRLFQMRIMKITPEKCAKIRANYIFKFLNICLCEVEGISSVII